MSRLHLTSDLARGLFRLSRELEELKRDASDLRAQHALFGLAQLLGAESAVATLGSATARRMHPATSRLTSITTWAFAAACGEARLQSVYEGPTPTGAHVLESPLDPARANPVASISVRRDDVLGAFSREEATALHLFHVECGWALAKDVARRDDATTTLTPRERATLACLLAGASEKEAAARLGLSIHTVHQYVKCLYKAYGVRSRAELMARCLRSGSEVAGRAA